MRHIFKIAGLAALLSAAALAAPDSASAQGFNVQIGPDRSRVIERRVYDEPRRYREPRVIERRVYRPAPSRTVCTMRINRYGERVRVCRTR